MSRDKLANELISEFAKYFAHELLPRLGAYPTEVAFQLYQQNSMIKAKADSFAASVMLIVDKHVAFNAPATPTRECSKSERADGDHVWISQNHQDLESDNSVTRVYCKMCGEQQQ